MGGQGLLPDFFGVVEEGPETLPHRGAQVGDRLPDQRVGGGPVGLGVVQQHRGRHMGNNTILIAQTDRFQGGERRCPDEAAHRSSSRIGGSSPGDCSPVRAVPPASGPGSPAGYGSTLLTAGLASMSSLNTPPSAGAASTATAPAVSLDSSSRSSAAGGHSPVEPRPCQFSR